MSKLVKLSDKLVVEARATSKLTERSISEQIEFWTSLGRAVDALLSGKTVLALKQRGDAVSLSDCFSDIDAPAGKARVEAVLKARPFPHYESGGKPGRLIKIDQDGKRTLGRFVNHKFQALKKSK